MTSLVHEQWQLCQGVAGNTLCAERIKQRLVIAQRYFTALSRQQHTGEGATQQKLLADDEQESAVHRDSLS